MLRVGLTGGIGSGKSLISRILISLNYPVFNSDQMAKSLLNHDLEIRSELTNRFGDELYMEGELDRKKLASIIFSDADARELVNGLVHPRVRKEFTDFCEAASNGIIFNEAAILFETGAYKNFDRNILVTAPEELRVNRVVQRDGSNTDEVRSRIRAQWPDSQKIPLADFVINNDEVAPLLVQVERILESLN